MTPQTGGRSSAGSALRAPVAILLAAMLVVTPRAFAQNPNFGELQFEGVTKNDRTAGVWVDGVYVGYVNALGDYGKLTLLPGEHEVVVRKSGYEDFTRKVIIEPRKKEKIRVALNKIPGASVPKQTSTLKLTVTPDRAAVFLDGHYIGHAAEFGGVWRSMEIAPGRHHIRVELPGYQPFDTEVNLTLGQKTEVSTTLIKGSVQESGAKVMPPQPQ